MAPGFLAVVAITVALAGVINGMAGFGFAVVGTMVLATVLDPATAVVFMIVPILSVNISLVTELSPDEVRRYLRRFWPLIVAALVGTILGMALLDEIPPDPLRVLLGLVAIGFVTTAQGIHPIPGFHRAKRRCFVETPPAMAGVGGLSGLLFGGTNVGVQLIAYLRSCDLSHGQFIGVVALTFLGLNSIRIAVAGALTLYPNPLSVWLSVAAIIPTVLGVGIGKRLREQVTEPHRKAIVLGLLSLIGIRLVLGGLGVM